MITQDEKKQLVIHTGLDYDGEMLVGLQNALSLAIEELGNNERNDGNDYKDAIWRLSYLLRSTLLNHSQTNVALNGREYGKNYDDETIAMMGMK